MRAVNLLPRDEQRERLQSARMPFLVAAGGIVLVSVVAALLTFSASGATDESEAELAGIEAAIANLPAPPQAAVGQGTLVRERSDRIEALAAALESRVAFDRLLQELAYVFPGDAWLTTLEASAPAVGDAAEDSAPAAPQGEGAEGVTIQGATYTHASVATVLARLSLVPSLKNVKLASSSLVEPSIAPRSGRTQPTAPAKRQKPFVTFVVSATLRTEAS